MATPAQASGFCAQIKAALQPDVKTDGVVAAGLDAKCTKSLTLGGGSSTNCFWRFEYRAAAATEFFERLLMDVVNCIGTPETTTRDKGVNHPDFYDLRQFSSEFGTVGLSLKDKGGLQETYVFLRLTPKIP